MALEYGDRIRGMQCFSDEPLLSEFRRCQELVAQEAVHNSMVATCRALGLWQEDAPVDEDCAWQDCSQPLEVITRRLQSHAAQVEAAGLTEKLSRRTRQASFIVEFGLEHGLPDKRDPTSEATLKDFLARLGEWEGGGSSENVRSLVLDSIPDGPAKEPLRKTTMEWFEENRGAAIVGGAIIGGVLGVLVAGATVALASSRGRRQSR